MEKNSCNYEGRILILLVEFIIRKYDWARQACFCFLLKVWKGYLVLLPWIRQFDEQFSAI